MDIADNTQELSFFAEGDELAKVTSTWEPYSPEQTRRRRNLIAVAVTGVILLIVAIMCVVALPASQA